jgi:hypothetical protein
MYISRFQVANYKSFREPMALEFTQGFNIISGQNSVGKTALLEALGLRFRGNPHRTLRTVPARDSIPEELSRVNVSFTVSPTEVKKYLLTRPPQTYHITKPDPGSVFARRCRYVDDSSESVTKLVEGFFREESITFDFTYTPGSAASDWRASRTPSYGIYAPRGAAGNFLYSPVIVQVPRRLASITSPNAVSR